jgi:nucleoside triphosphate pyrophosphatase
MRLILASASPRRAELLRGGGYVFETIVTDVDERLQPGEEPSQYVRRLAAEKSAAALGRVTGRTDEVVVLGADTAVIVDGAVLGKPCDEEEATAMLRRLSGRAHEVLTGISLRNSASEVGRVEVTVVRFRPLSGDEVAAYVSSGEGRDKAGGYAIQGLASTFVSLIQGSHSNVVGLPMEALAELLPEFRR